MVGFLRKDVRAIILILTALTFISMFCCPSAVYAEDNTISESNGLLKSDFFKNLAEHGFKEAEKRISWKSEYALVKYYSENRAFVLDKERPSIFDDEQLELLNKNLKKDIERSFGYTLKNDLRDVPVVIKAEKFLRSITSFRVQNHDSGYGNKRKFISPSAKDDAVDIEMEIDRELRELEIIQDVNSPKGQLKKIFLEKEINRLQYEKISQYPFTAKISARTGAKKESGELIGKLSPYLKTEYKNVSIETRYNLRNKTKSGFSDFEFVLNWLLSDDMSAFASYKPKSGKTITGIRKIFDDAIGQINYVSSGKGRPKKSELSLTKIFDKKISVTVSCDASFQSEDTERDEYSAQISFYYVF